MMAFVIGLLGGFTKFPCYLCYWDSRGTTARYQRRISPKRTKLFIGKSNIKWDPLIDPSKILMSPLHIKLGLIKQFVKALDKNSDAFKYLQNCFPKISEAKIKAGIFVGPQIRKILECNKFLEKLSTTERAAWNSFVVVVRWFLSNQNFCGAGCQIRVNL